MTWNVADGSVTLYQAHTYLESETCPVAFHVDTEAGKVTRQITDCPKMPSQHLVNSVSKHF